MQTPITDLTFLKTFTTGNKEKMAKYINMFLQAAPGIIENMETHLANSDWKQLRTAAHSLKPQAGYMGMKQGETVLKTIEECASEQKDLDTVPSHIEEFKIQFNQAKEELTNAIS
jgi:HPt (histidine-containing phosphotransfer) domain-containing protein